MDMISKPHITKIIARHEYKQRVNFHVNIESEEYFSKYFDEQLIITKTNKYYE